MKSDVLSGFDSIKVCTGYEYMGKIIHHLPYDMNQNAIKPIYVECKGWHQDISKMNNIDDLPNECQTYIQFLEKELQIPISIISVGPDRLQTIFK